MNGRAAKAARTASTALSKASLSPAQMNEVKQLRSQGEAHHKAVRHAESVAALTKAKGMLNIK